MCSRVLGSVASIIMGQSPSGDNVTTTPQGLPLLNGPTEFGPYHPVPVQYTSDVRKKAENGDLLFCVRGSTTGRMNWADRGYAIGRGLAAIRHNEDIRLQPLIRAVIEYSLKDLLAQATGSTFPNISASQLASIPFPALSLKEQLAIANILGTLDDKIELNRKMNETLEAMVRALFKSWFVDFDPVRAKAGGRDTGLPKEVADLFPDEFEDSELGEIPKGWKVVPAGRLFGINIGKTPPRKESRWFSESREDIPWISIKDLGGCGPFIQKTTECLTKEAVERFHIRLIPEGTVVLSFKLTLGRVAITDGVMLSNEAIAHFLPYPETTLTTDFLFCYLKQFNFDILGNTSSIATAVNSESIRSLPLLIPGEKQVLRFSSGVASMFSKMKCLQSENVELVQLREVLLPKLLSGELRVFEAKKIAEAVS